MLGNEANRIGIKFFGASILNAYSSLFYSYNKLFGLLLLLASFFYPASGIAGLVGIFTAMLLARIFRYDKALVLDGTLTFNSMMVGVGLGIMFECNVVMLVCVVLAASIAFLFTVLAWNVLGKYKLPFLSLPFLLTLWCVLPSFHQFSFVQPNNVDIYYLNFLYRMGGNTLVEGFRQANFEWFSPIVGSYFKTLSVIFFQNNIFTGMIIAVGLLIHSRIAFSLSIIGYLTAYSFYRFAGIDIAVFLQFHAGFNYIIVAMALGAHYTIPSWSSYALAIVATLCCVLVGLGVNDLMGHIGVPSYSLAFVLVVLLTLLALRQRPLNKFPELVLLQYCSPEKNLYKQQNNTARLKNLVYYPIRFPFFGEWMVSQGYDGTHTHKGEWSKALDFVLVDDELKQNKSEGNYKEDYYCYGKPITAPANGYVMQIADLIEDNDIGSMNTSENWGNSIILKHAEGLYSQISHLKKNSFRVRVSDYVKAGDLLALAGNSGRSPIPHLHFQLQWLPVVGAKTMEYPLACYIKKEKGENQLRTFSIPQEGEIVSNVEVCVLLKEAFDILPGRKMKFLFTKDGEETICEWECFTDAYNRKYLFDAATNSVAYFINDETLFYFTDFEGDRDSLLYYFYLGLYKVLLGYYEDVQLTDKFPISLFINRYFFINDFIAPFFNVVDADFELNYKTIDNVHAPEKIELQSTTKVLFGKTVSRSLQFNITLQHHRIDTITIQKGNSTFTAVWQD